jgi:enterochelin esterase family protein
MVADGTLPPHHLVLLSPVERNDWYSANPAYARALAREVLPTLRGELGDGPVVALGASLGGLAVLHAHRRSPGLFGGLFLQSGSFFQRRFDAQESGFAHYRRITRFVGEVGRHRSGAPVPTTITCGLGEENLANNRDMAAVLRAQGYPVEFVEVPDAHNLVAWRDAWHPHLADLARKVWTDDRPATQDA